MSRPRTFAQLLPTKIPDAAMRDLTKQSGISRSYISRLFSGEAHELPKDNFTVLLKVFAADSQAQAELVATVAWTCAPARVRNWSNR